MKKQILVALSAAAAAAMLLTACVNSETSQYANGSAAASGSNGVSADASSAGSAENGGGSDASANASAASGEQNSSQTAENGGTGSSDSAANADGGAENADNTGSGEDSPENTYDVLNQSGDDATGQDLPADAGMEVENIEDETDAYGWSGTFESVSGEILTVGEDGEDITFAFENAGISGKAQMEGDAAVFHGDDDYTVTFVLDDVNIEVRVGDGSTEESNGIESPLAGTYSRQ